MLFTIALQAGTPHTSALSTEAILNRYRLSERGMQDRGDEGTGGKPIKASEFGSSKSPRFLSPIACLDP